MIRISLLMLITALLAACGQTGPLYLTTDYKAQHATTEQKDPPSESLQPLKSDQRIVQSN